MGLISWPAVWANLWLAWTDLLTVVSGVKRLTLAEKNSEGDGYAVFSFAYTCTLTYSVEQNPCVNTNTYTNYVLMH